MPDSTVLADPDKRRYSLLFLNQPQFTVLQVNLGALRPRQDVDSLIQKWLDVPRVP